MPDPDIQAPSTLGRRIDALLGPLETEALQYREAIDLGCEQVAKMQSKIAQAERALAEIEQQMADVLDTLARDEPLLSQTVGRVAAPVQTAPTHTPPTAAVEAGPVPSAMSQPPQTLAPPPVPALPAAQPATPAQESQAVTPPQPVFTPEPPPGAQTDQADPPPMNDAQAVGEIMGLLESGTAPDASEGSQEGHAGPLADAAEQAQQAAQQLGGAMPEPGPSA